MTVVEWSVPGEQTLLVGAANGSALERDPVLDDAVRGRFIEEMQADDDHLVMEIAGDIYLYTRGAPGTPSTVENLTRSPSMQFDPWVSGRYVVWTDQRHGPSGTAWQLDNTEVYLYDLETRLERRITNDPPERPVIQHYARVSGDWIVWADQRNSGLPNTYPVAGNVPLYLEVYGYHIPTGREVPLVTGRNMLGAIALQRGELWYNCSILSPRADGVYRMPMPAMPR